MLEAKRARRRRLTERTVKRRQRAFLMMILGAPEDFPKPILSDSWFAKQSVNCNCSKRRHGSPRVNRGMCTIGSRNRIYRWRREARELNLMVTRYGEEPDEDLAGSDRGVRSNG